MDNFCQNKWTMRNRTVRSQTTAAAVFSSSVWLSLKQQMHYIHLPFTAVVKTPDQTSLRESHLFTRFFVLMSRSEADQSAIVRWEQSRNLVVREKENHIKMFDGISRWMWCIVFWKRFPVASCRAASMPTEQWCVVRKEKNYMVKLQRLGSPPHS